MSRSARDRCAAPPGRTFRIRHRHRRSPKSQVTVLGVIPARGGSKGLPRKNVLPLLGKPVIAYTIEAALEAKHLNHVVVSTDDDEIASVAAACGVEVVRRPAELATDDIAIDPALRHALREVEASRGRVEVLVWLQANVPTTRPEIVDAVVEKFLATRPSCVQTVVPYRAPPQWAWRIDGDRMAPLEGVYSYSTRRQDVVPAYHPDGAVIAIDRDVLMAAEGKPPPAYLGSDRRAVVQDAKYSIEIDEPGDVYFCEVAIRMAREERERASG